ncbi:MAG: LamG-like jellyroll fold domain-containing protein [bacterium]|jgi:hypothetical protein
MMSINSKGRTYRESVKSIIAMAVTFLTVFSLSTLPLSAAENLIKNPGFEKLARDGYPADWKRGIMAGGTFGEGKFELSIENTGSYKGERCIRITGTEVIGDWPRAQYIQELTLKPYTDYEVKFWYKTNLKLRHAGLYISPKIKELKLPPSSTWTSYSVQFNTDDASNVSIWLRNFGLGDVWFDEVSLIEIEGSKAEQRSEGKKEGDNRVISFFPDHNLKADTATLLLLNFDTENDKVRMVNLPKKNLCVGISGQGMQFTGDSSQYIEAPGDMVLGERVTIEAWVYPESTGKGNTFFILDKRYAPAGGLALYIIDGLPTLFVNGKTIRDSAYKIEAHKWHHIAVERNGKRARLYMDGVLIKEDYIPQFIDRKTPCLIGKAALGFNSEDKNVYPWKGKIDEIRISDINRYDASNISKTENYIVPQRKGRIELDGYPGEVAWDNGMLADSFFVLGTRKATEVATIVKALYDNDYLYLAFECEEPLPDKISSRCKERDENVYLDDCTAVFIHSPKGRYYVQYCMNSEGVLFDEKIIISEWGRYNNRWYGQSNDLISLPSRNWNSTGIVCRTRVDAAKKRWYAEWKIPLNDLNINGNPTGEALDVNFCRIRRGAGMDDYTWSYIPGKSFHAVNYFNRLFLGRKAEAAAPVKSAGVTVDSGKLQSVTGSAMKVTVLDGKKITRAEAFCVVPSLKRMKTGKGVFNIKSDTLIIAGDDVEYGTDLLQKDIKDLYHFALPVESAACTYPRSNFILVGNAGTNKAVKRLLDMEKMQFNGSSPEEYILIVRSSYVLVAGQSSRGVFYGLQTLRQLLSRRPQFPIQEAVIHDWPDIKGIRGFHFFLPRTNGEAEMEAILKLIDVISCLKYNTIFFEIDERMQYDNEPKLAVSGAFTKQQVKKIRDFAQSRYLKIIPCIQGWSHGNWWVNRTHYGHLFETKSEIETNLCLSNPKGYDLMYRLIDELIGLFKPEYLMINFDEFNHGNIGICELCRSKQPYKLLADVENAVNKYLKAKGIRTIVAADPLLPGDLTLGGTGGAPQFTVKALPLLSKDIILWDWKYWYSKHYSRYPSMDYLQKNGNQVIAAGWTDPLNIYHLTNKAADVNAVGYVATTWWAGIASLIRMPKLMAEIVLSAQYSWSKGRPSLDDIRFNPVDKFNSLMNIRSEEHNAADEFYLFDLAPFANAGITAGESSWLGDDKSLVFDIPGGINRLGSIPFKLCDNPQGGCVVLRGKDSRYPGEIMLPINKKLNSLFFLHTTSKPEVNFARQDIFSTNRDAPKNVARYKINYLNGRSSVLQLCYGNQIVSWNGELPGASDAVTVWSKTLKNGAYASLTSYRWINPYPDEEIASINYISDMSEVNPVLFAVTGMGSK